MPFSCLHINEISTLCQPHDTSYHITRAICYMTSGESDDVIALYPMPSFSILRHACRRDADAVAGRRPPDILAFDTEYRPPNSRLWRLIMALAPLYRRWAAADLICPRAIADAGCLLGRMPAGRQLAPRARPGIFDARRRLVGDAKYIKIAEHIQEAEPADGAALRLHMRAARRCKRRAAQHCSSNAMAIMRWKVGDGLATLGSRPGGFDKARGALFRRILLRRRLR